MAMAFAQLLENSADALRMILEPRLRFRLGELLANVFDRPFASTPRVAGVVSFRGILASSSCFCLARGPKKTPEIVEVNFVCRGYDDRIHV